ncbi:MAG: flagellar hook protein FlgE [Bryobacteraceae bacterium]|jgi:flagellar hook protein FlgE
MFTSLSAAVSGLRADSTAFSVVGNNLANLNTAGYKASVVYFRDLVTNAIGEGLTATEVGFGTASPITEREFTQGAVQSSTGTLDGAIQGEGFFVLKDASGVTSFTRAGNFTTDSNGVVVTDTGEHVQGWMVDPKTGQVDTNSPISDITLAVGSLKQPIATKDVTLDLNLNSAAAVTGSPALSYPVQVYDSLGTAHVLTFDFTKKADNQWTYNVSLPGEDLTGGKPGTPSVLTTGELDFDSNGQLTSPAAGSPIGITASKLADDASDLKLSWDPYNASGAGRITQFANASEVSASAQDGSAGAQLSQVGLSDGGTIVAQYSDGQQMVVAQLATASIRNPDSLVAEGNNKYQVTAGTATPVIGVPGTGGRGNVVGASIEASTVDVATEFTNLIVYQRAYEANAKVVTSADELSQETINLIH